MSLSYISTRGLSEPKNFTDVLLAGLATDGGLYLPQRWDALDVGTLKGKDYAAIAETVLTPFIGDTIAQNDLSRILRETYHGGAFEHPSVAPLVELKDGVYILELFHGLTLSFKDYALQLLGRLFDHVLTRSGQKITIVGATSGDTGSAAIEACKTCKNIDIVILHPKGRTSDLQRKQMTTVDAPNVRNVAIEGTFDDCQAIVKTLFSDETLRQELNLSAVNSINWARIAAQIVYYVAAGVALDQPASFIVPTGNFGNVFAAWGARRIGLPVQSLTLATNRNDILTRFFETGAMTMEGVVPTISPSMDIQISSNFERYLFELLGRNTDAVRDLMVHFKTSGTFKVSDAVLQKAQKDFHASRCSETETLAAMKHCYDDTKYILDPHTATAYHAAFTTKSQSPVVIVATAHPAKFPEAVKSAIGINPPLPDCLAAVMDKPERFTVLPNDAEAVKAFVRG
jgi:threonine synthase